MSVILNALRSHKGSGSSSAKSVGSGAFVSRRGKTSKSPLAGKILIVVLLVASMFTGVMIWFKNYLTRRTTAQNSALIAKAPPPMPAIPKVDEGLAKARSLFHQERLTESLEVYQVELAKNPTNALLHNDVGLVLLKLDLFKESERHFVRATEIDASCFECYNNMGYLKTLLNQTTDAEKYFKKALAINSSYPDAYFNLAVLYEKNGDIGNAVNTYKEFMERLPDKKASYYVETQARVKALLER